MGLRPGKAKGPYVGMSGPTGGTPTNPTSVPTWFPCIAFAYTDFTGFAALVGDVEKYSLPAKCTIEGVALHTDVAFTGPGITAVTLSVGLVGNLAKYLSAYDAFAAASNTRIGAANLLFPENLGAVTSIRLSAQSVGANLSVLTAGSGCLWLKVAKLTP
jgi:hypothetical protein